LQHRSISCPTTGWIRRLWVDCVKPESRLSMVRRSIDDQGPWIAVALFWILHSVRPMSVQELDVLLAFEESRGQDSESNFFADRASVASLPVLLPGVADIIDEKTLVCRP